MVKALFAIKISEDVLRNFKTFCKDRGIKYGFFVEEALRGKLREEELKEDLLDLRTLQAEEKHAVSFEDYLKKRRV